MATIVIIEDEENLSNLVRRHLTEEGYRVFQALDGPAGLQLVAQHNPDLVILDIMLPKLDGLEVCRQIRKERITPILMLTAKTEEIDRVVGLEMGADDYLTKPFGIRELLARVKAILRRLEMMRAKSQLPDSQIVEVADLLIDTANHEVRVADRPIELTSKEFKLLSLLALNPGRVFSREYLLDRIWGLEYDGFDRAVDNCVLRLRNKLGRGSRAAERITTIWGVGYKFERE